jgi:hypothetical protein
MAHEHPHSVDLTVIVNGQTTVVKTSSEAKLGSIIPEALEQTGNSGQPPSNWELRDADGKVLDLHREIDDFHFPKDVKLFLNLKAGVGG